MIYSYDNVCVRNMISLELNLYESNGCFSFVKTQSFLGFFYHYLYLNMTKIHLTYLISIFLYSPLFSFKNVNENFIEILRVVQKI